MADQIDRRKQTIIIKRVKKAGHKHHGGAWKVAYADFVTAMMAFFLLLWLLNSVTEEQLQGISNYFAPGALSESKSGAGGILGGRTLGEGAMTSQGATPSISMALPPPTIGQGGQDFTDPAEGQMSEEEMQEMMASREQQQFQAAQEALQQALQSLPELKPLAQNLLIDNTAEGLRIQIVDQEGLTMFPRGSSSMFGHTRRLLDLIAKVVVQMPQKIAVSGHTDATRFASDTGYTNWELSADRALSSRRVLVETGVPEDRVARVVGKADQDPLIQDDPADPRNRRISVTLLRENRVPEGAEMDGGPPLPPARHQTGSPLPPSMQR